MRRHALVLVAGLAAIAATLPAHADDKPIPQAKEGDGELICRSEGSTGTRFKKRVCMTKAQRDAMAERDRRGFAETANKSPIGPEGN